MRRAVPALIVVAALASSVSPAGQSATLLPAQLRCEYDENPLGVDASAPRLSWQVRSAERGQRQSAWQVIVATTPDVLQAGRGDLWDSGRIASNQTTHVGYGGAPLSSSRRVFWKVRVWDRESRPSVWSEVATWTMGVMTPGDWKASWIAAPGATETLLLRRGFAVSAGLKRAVVHVCGLGQYELTLNGTKVGDNLLSPGWTNYDRTTLYDTYDVTAAVREGANAAGLFLGNGMYHVVRRNRFAKFTGSFGPLRAIAQFRLEYGDGRVEWVVTDGSWRTHPGPITYSSIYGGEDHDARLEPIGWDRPGFDDRAWTAAVPVIRLPDTLRGHSASANPIRAIESRQPVAARTFADGSVVYDFGQNASFMPRVRVAGPAGAVIRLTPAEVINPDGTIFRGTMGGDHRGSAWWQYTKATGDDESWFPRFYYVGSRYLRAELIPAGDGGGSAPRIVSIEAVVVHSNAAPIGRFTCSNPLLNQIRDLVRWAQRSNMVSVLTDCPHREKLGWLEQLHLNGPSIRYEFDVARIYTKAMQDMADSQTPEGLVPNIAPEYTRFEGAFRAATEWGAAFVAVPWQQYLFLGDRELLAKHYEAMKRYFAYLESRTSDGLLDEGLGDWYDLDLAKTGQAGLTPARITATAYYYQDADLLGRIASLLGHDEDARAYASRAAAIRARYHRAFSDAAAHRYGTNSQASLAIPLALGLAGPDARADMLGLLVRDVEGRGYATAGDVGFRSLLRALAEAGRSDVIYALVNQDEKPGYGYQIKKGATSLTEAWDANLGSSHNHFMLGQVTEWLYRDVAGIDVDPAGPGFEKIIIRPTPVGDLSWAEAGYDSIRGPIAVHWERDKARFALRVTIPANTTATVFLPGTERSIVKEGGRPAAGRAGVKELERRGGQIRLSIESGTYAFEVS